MDLVSEVDNCEPLIDIVDWIRLETYYYKKIRISAPLVDNFANV